MHIGIVGPKLSCDIIQEKMAKIDKNVALISYPHEQIYIPDEILDACEAQCDAIMFTGCAVENYVISTRPLDNILHTSVEKSIISVSGAFLEMQKQGLDIDAFSIDILESQMIEDLLDSFDIKTDNVYLRKMKPENKESDYLSWHMSLQDEGKTNVALTAFKWVYDQLIEKGYQSIYLAPTKAMIRVAYERLKNKMAITKAGYSQIAIELIKIKDFETITENYYSSMLKKVDIEKEVIKYVQGIQGSVFSFSENEYVIFSNAGIIKNERNYGSIEALQDIVSKQGVQLFIGIGMGTTVYEAETNARKALKASLKSDKSEVFIVDEDNNLEGPLGTSDRLKYKLLTNDPRIKKASIDTGLSEQSILKILAIGKARNSFVFDANELAQCLEITPRSARRIMNKLEESGYGEVYAKEISTSGGRPKKLLKINLTKK